MLKQLMLSLVMVISVKSGFPISQNFKHDRLQESAKFAYICKHKLYDYRPDIEGKCASFKKQADKEYTRRKFRWIKLR